jgi:hypothetical protein
MSAISKLKAEAKRLYIEANDFDFSCGRKLSEYIRPSIAIARVEFSKVWIQVKAVDPSAPDDPFLCGGCSE